MNPPSDLEKMLVEFHTKQRQYRLGTPSASVPAEVALLRTRLMMEELAETITGIHEHDLERIADGLMDLLYVTIGTCVAYGIPLYPCFEEVHRSNMTKDPPDTNEFMLGAKYGYNHGTKAGKGPNYRPPNLKQFLNLP